jgi:hypothetical protein
VWRAVSVSARMHALAAWDLVCASAEAQQGSARARSHAQFLAMDGSLMPPLPARVQHSWPGALSRPRRASARATRAHVGPNRALPAGKHSHAHSVLAGESGRALYRSRSPASAANSRASRGNAHAAPDPRYTRRQASGLTAFLPARADARADSVAVVTAPR